MNEQNFDKILKQKMATERDFPFSDEKWDKMEQKLDDFQAQKRYYRLLWATVLPFLGLLSALFFVIGQLQETQRSLLELKKEIQQSQRPKTGETVVSDSLRKGSTVQKDTVYQHIIIKRYDTIFQTIVQRTLSEAELKSKSDETLKTAKILSSTPNKFIFQSEKKTTTTTDAKPERHNPQPDADPLSMTGKKEPSQQSFKPASPTSVDTGRSNTSVNEPQNTETQSQIVHPIPNESTTNTVDKKDSVKLSATSVSKLSVDTNQRTTPLTESDIIPPLSIIDEKKETTTEVAKKPILKPLKWGRLETGLSMGTAAIVGRDIDRQKGFSTGIKLHWLLGERFKIVGEAQFMRLSYTLDTLSRAYDLPTVNPPTLNDVLTGVEADPMLGQMAVGVQYDLARRRLRPFVGMSLVGEWSLGGKYEFMFTNSLTNRNSSILSKRHRNDFNLLYARMNAGFSYPISNKLKLQLEGSFDVPIEHKMMSQPLRQMRGTVLYRF